MSKLASQKIKETLYKVNETKVTKATNARIYS